MKVFEESSKQGSISCAAAKLVEPDTWIVGGNLSRWMTILIIMMMTMLMIMIMELLIMMMMMTILMTLMKIENFDMTMYKMCTLFELDLFFKGTQVR